MRPLRRSRHRPVVLDHQVLHLPLSRISNAVELPRRGEKACVRSDRHGIAAENELRGPLHEEEEFGFGVAMRRMGGRMRVDDAELQSLPLDETPVGKPVLVPDSSRLLQRLPKLVHIVSNGRFLSGRGERVILGKG